jgi:hypothetical protein
VAAGGDQHEQMPNRILKSQALPAMKNNAYRIKRASCRKKP